MAWFKRVHRPNAPVCGLSKNKTPSATAPQYHRTCIMQVYSLPRIIRTGFDYDTRGTEHAEDRKTTQRAKSQRRQEEKTPYREGRVASARGAAQKYVPLPPRAPNGRLETPHSRSGGVSFLSVSAATKKAIGIDSSVPRSCNGEFVFQSGCHRSLQNQPRRVESKPATPKCLIHIKFLDPSKRHFNFFKSAAHQPMSCAAKMLPLLPCDIRQTPRGLHASTAVVSGAICRDTSSQFRRSQPPPTG